MNNDDNNDLTSINANAARQLSFVPHLCQRALHSYNIPNEGLVDKEQVQNVAGFKSKLLTTICNLILVKKKKKTKKKDRRPKLLELTIV